MPLILSIQPAKAQTPAAPTNFRTTYTSPGIIIFAWDDNSNNETSFKVEKYSSIPNSFSDGRVVGANITSLTWDNICDYYSYPCSNKYFSFRVSAKNATGYSNFSNYLTVLLPANSNLPPPSNLQATPVSGSIIDLSWQDNSSNELGFVVEFSRYDTTLPVPNYLAWCNLAYSVITFCPQLQPDQEITVGPNVTSYSFNLQQETRAANTDFYFRVNAYNQEGYSAYSEIINSKMLAIVGTPNAPTNLVATPQPDKISLSWTNPGGPQASGFIVERSQDPTRHFIYLNLGSYQDTTAIPGKTYYYRVKYYSFTGGTSNYSNIANAQVADSGTRPNLVVTKLADKTQVNSNEMITYIIDVVNNGDKHALNVNISDEIPSNAVLVGGPNSGGSFDGNKIFWNNDYIAPENSQKFIFSVWAK